MEHLPHVDELAIVAAAAVLVALVLARLRLPTVTGFLVTGALLGPAGLGIVRDTDLIEALAEIGVVFLLFSIGLELSMARLRAIARVVLFGGGAQVVLTATLTALVALALGRPSSTSVVYGCVLALSSTAIVLRELSARGELSAPHGGFVVGVLIFQDLCVVPMVLLVPMLGAGDGTALLESVALALGRAAIVVVATLSLARFAVPRLFAAVDASRSREVFLLAVLAVCLGIAWLTSLTGLSLALGAFLAGVILSDTEFGHRAAADVLPLRDAFVSVFFVSLGMLFDARALVSTPMLVLGLFAGFVVAKGALAALVAVALRLPARAAWLAGVALAQFGEFGFVLTRLAGQAGLIDASEASALFAAGILSMLVSPVLLRAAPHVTLAERLLGPMARMRGGTESRVIAHAPHESGHVVVVGFGIAGKLVVRALLASGVRVAVLELNVATVRAARAQGLPVSYGDATSPDALELAGAPRAAALVLVLNDPAATERIVGAARRVAPDVPILARAHHASEAERLLRLGAADAIAEETESGIEIVARVLRRLEIPRNVIVTRIEEARAAVASTAARPLSIPRKVLGEHAQLAGLKIDSLRLEPGSPAVGRTIRELDLQRRTGALVVAVRRGDELVAGSELDTPLDAADVVFVVGPLAAIAAATDLLAPGHAAPEAAAQ